MFNLGDDHLYYYSKDVQGVLVVQFQNVSQTFRISLVELNLETVGLQNCLMVLYSKRGRLGLLFLTFNLADVYFTYGARRINSFGFNSI